MLWKPNGSEPDGDDMDTGSERRVRGIESFAYVGVRERVRRERKERERGSSLMMGVPEEGKASLDEKYEERKRRSERSERGENNVRRTYRPYLARYIYALLTS